MQVENEIRFRVFFIKKGIDLVINLRILCWIKKLKPGTICWFSR